MLKVIQVSVTTMKASRLFIVVVASLPMRKKQKPAARVMANDKMNGNVSTL